MQPVHNFTILIHRNLKNTVGHISIAFLLHISLENAFGHIIIQFLIHRNLKNTGDDIYNKLMHT